MPSMRFLTSLLGAIVVSSCASAAHHDSIAVVQSYLSSKTRDEAVSFFAPDYRLWFGKRSGDGIDRAHVAKMLEWDYALNARHRIDTITAHGAEVTAQVHEDNDFSRLIGFPGWDASSTFVVDEEGRIVSQLYVPTGATDWRPYLDRPLEWIREHYPDALPRIFPDGKLVQTAESAREWVALLREWRAATGQ
jgi:hypothetical protein